MMIIKNWCVYTVLLASLMCSLGCSHSGVGSDATHYKQVYYYGDIKSEFQITIDNSWERLEIVENPHELRFEEESLFLMKFRSEEDCIVTVFIGHEYGTLYSTRNRYRPKFEELPWTVHHSLFDMEIYSSDNDGFTALTDSFAWEEYSMHINIEGSCNMPRDELEALVLSIKFESP